jgi:hypothetical protein
MVYWHSSRLRIEVHFLGLSVSHEREIKGLKKGIIGNKLCDFERERDGWVVSL